MNICEICLGPIGEYQYFLECDFGHVFHDKCISVDFINQKMNESSFEIIKSRYEKLGIKLEYDVEFNKDHNIIVILGWQIMNIIFKGLIKIPIDMCPLCSFDNVSHKDAMMALEIISGENPLMLNRFMRNAFETSQGLRRKHKSIIGRKNGK